MSLLIRDATLITMDEAGSIHAPGAVLVDGPRIVEVGSSEEVAARAPKDCEVIDAKGRIALPGFVSAHNHLGYTVFRGRAEDIGHAPTHRVYLPMSMVMRRDEREVLGSLAVAELLRGGVTTVFQMEEDAEALLPFIERSGIRASVGLMTHDVDLERLMEGETVFDEGERRRQLDRAIELAHECDGAAEGRVSGVITTNGLATSSPELLRALRAAADRHGLRLSVHLGTGERDMVREIHGMEPFEYARANGFLGEDVLAVHCYTIDEADIDALAETGTRLAHCPLMNQFRGAIAPVGLMLERGVTVGLGIDNYFSDFFDLIRSCVAVARIRADRPEVMQAPEALALATIGAARAVGQDDRIGSIEAGKRADIQLVDMRRYGLTPVTDPVRTLVYHAHAKDVETVLVDGRVLVRDRALLAIDEDDLVERAAVAGAAAWERFRERFGAYVL